MPSPTTHPLYDLIAPSNRAAPSDEVVRRYLGAIRTHLGMDVAYVSQFIAGRSHLREVDAPGLEAHVKAGDSFPLDDIYCRHILDGSLPQLIPDTSLEPLAAALPITQAVPIGKHLSVPIRLPDGSTYGMLCCLGFRADPSLRERDLQMMRVLADLAAFAINQDLAAANANEDKRRRIEAVIAQQLYCVVYQPIWKISTQKLIGFESLARFSPAPARPPDQWFADAAEVGLGAALELAVARVALSELASFPAEMYLTVNVSPEVILDGDLAGVLEGLPPGRVVLEVTEHAQVDDYARLSRALRPLRDRGILLAVDDAGAGYSSLQHILQLRPDLIKLDTSLTRQIDTDTARHALASALVGFATSTGCRIIAEGVKTALEMQALLAIGVERAQGYYLGRPMARDEAVKLAGRHRLRGLASAPDPCGPPCEVRS